MKHREDRRGFWKMKQREAQPGFTLMSDFIGEMVLLRDRDPFTGKGAKRINVADFPVIGRQFGVKMESYFRGPVIFTCQICGEMIGKAQCDPDKHKAFYDELEEERMNEVEPLIALEHDRRREQLP